VVVSEDPSTRTHDDRYDVEPDINGTENPVREKVSGDRFDFPTLLRGDRLLRMSEVGSGACFDLDGSTSLRLHR
jgi:hypothetical protein